jgi:flagellar biosynthesis protein FliR
MISFGIENYPLVLAFWLAFTRVLSILIQIPLFDNAVVPIRVKVLGSLLITYAFFTPISVNLLTDIGLIGGKSFWFLTMFNLLVGLGLGFFVKIIMQIFISAGSIITQEIGFGAVRYFDPTTTQQVGPFEKIITWTLLIMILSTGALYPMLEGILKSFETLSFKNFSHKFNYSEYFLIFFKHSFESSILLASPLIFTNALIMAVLGIITRLVPQMNVLMVSFVINIGMGLLVFWATMGEFFNTSYKIYAENLGKWFKFLI